MGKIKDFFFTLNLFYHFFSSENVNENITIKIEYLHFGYIPQYQLDENKL